ncbi:hypothetical protein I549_1930 [Mycobacterium avium subsp. avium 2285 (R)]|nr:hypothetical protein I549_1930 [Mycobacterium avium subsp. avium 2285 (R)]
MGAVGMQIIHAGSSAQTAETKAYEDGHAYHSVARLGLEPPINAAFRVGAMATNLVGWFGKGGAETEATAGSLTTTKVLIAIEVAAAEAIIAAKESEIAALQATSLRPEIRERRIQQLRNEIQQTINEAKRDIEALYNGLYTPTTPAPLGLTPLVFKGSPPVGSGNGTNRHGGESGPGAPGGGVKASPVDSNGSPAEKPQYDETAPSNQKPSTEPAQNTAKSDEVTKPQSQASGQLQPGQSETRVVPQKSGQLGTNGAGVAPQPPTSIGASTPGSGAGSGLSGVGGGVPKMAGLSPPSSPLPTSGLSGGGLPAGGSGLAGSGLPSSGSIPGGGAAGSPAAAPPPAQFLSGAAQGFASSAPVTSSAAAAQPFRPPPGRRCLLGRRLRFHLLRLRRLWVSRLCPHSRGLAASD